MAAPKKYKTLTEKWAAEDAAKAASKAKSAPAPAKKAPEKKSLNLREMIKDRKRMIDEASSSSRKTSSRKKR